ncbi:hypothetical protein TRFO_24022 [Tritrichomonas foetus]|uniref:Uncharacterized protein n=1 Tax=Tritrichomonas foetus TaxID=1144522 RepID=A0A1J4KDI2_9EUKA|nr:hypothetical protein TRFO_24022 [Tritrichomonas foetus]|eukprot:OHT07686.1 hypothetical protein TRFO_24022 [Tritrichomonas foetus]
MSFFLLFFHLVHAAYYIIDNTQQEGSKVTYDGLQYTVITLSNHKSFIANDYILFRNSLTIPSDSSFPTNGPVYFQSDKKAIELLISTNIVVVFMGNFLIKGNTYNEVTVQKSYLESEVEIRNSVISSLQIGHRTTIRTYGTTSLPQYSESNGIITGLIEIEYDLLESGKLIVDSSVKNRNLRIEVTTFSSTQKYLNDVGNNFIVIDGSSAMNSAISVSLSEINNIDYGLKIDFSLMKTDDKYQLTFKQNESTKLISKICFDENSCPEGFEFVTDLQFVYGIEEIDCSTFHKEIILTASQVKSGFLTISFCSNSQAGISSIDIFPDALNRLTYKYQYIYNSYKFNEIYSEFEEKNILKIYNETLIQKEIQQMKSKTIKELTFYLIHLNIKSGSIVEVCKKVESSFGSETAHIGSLESSNVKLNYYGNCNIDINLHTSVIELFSNSFSTFNDTNIVTIEYGKWPAFLTDLIPYIILPYSENPQISIPKTKLIYSSEVTISTITTIPLIAYSSINDYQLDIFEDFFKNKITLDITELIIHGITYIITPNLKKKKTSTNLFYYGTGIDFEEFIITEDTEKACYKIHLTTGEECPTGYKEITKLVGLRGIKDLYFIYEREATSTSIEIPYSILNDTEIQIRGNRYLYLKNYLNIHIIDDAKTPSFEIITLTNGYFSLNTLSGNIHNLILENCEAQLVTNAGIYSTFEIDSLSQLLYVNPIMNHNFKAFIHCDGNNIGYFMYDLETGSTESFQSNITIVFDSGIRAFSLAYPCFFEFYGSTNLFNNINYIYERIIKLDHICVVSHIITDKSVSIHIEVTENDAYNFCYKPNNEYLCEEGFIPISYFDRIPIIESVYAYRENGDILIEGLNVNQVENGIIFYSKTTSINIETVRKKAIISFEKEIVNTNRISYLKFTGHVFWQITSNNYFYTNNIILEDGYFWMIPRSFNTESYTFDVKQGSYLLIETSIESSYISRVNLEYGGSKSSGLIFSEMSIIENLNFLRLQYDGTPISGDRLKYPFIIDAHSLQTPIGRLTSKLDFTNIHQNNQLIVLKHNTGQFSIFNNSYFYIFDLINPNDPLRVCFGDTNEVSRSLLSLTNYWYITNIVYSYVTVGDYEISSEYFKNITIESRNQVVIITPSNSNIDISIHSISTQIEINADVSRLTLSGNSSSLLNVNAMISNKITILGSGKFHFLKNIQCQIEVSNTMNDYANLFFVSYPEIFLIQPSRIRYTVLYSTGVLTYELIRKIKIDETKYFYYFKNLVYNQNTHANPFIQFDCKFYEKIKSPKLCIGSQYSCDSNGYSIENGYTLYFNSNYNEPAGYHSIEEIVILQNTKANFFIEGFINNDDYFYDRYKVKFISNKVSYMTINLFSKLDLTESTNSFDITGTLDFIKNDNIFNSSSSVAIQSIIINSGSSSFSGIISQKTFINKNGKGSFLLPQLTINEYKVEINYYENESIEYTFYPDVINFVIPYTKINLFTATTDYNGSIIGIQDTNHVGQGELLRQYIDSNYEIYVSNSYCDYIVKPVTLQESYKLYGYSINSNSTEECCESNSVEIKTFTPSHEFSPSNTFIPTPIVPNYDINFTTIQLNLFTISIYNGTITGIEDFDLDEFDSVIIENSYFGFVFYIDDYHPNNNKIYVAAIIPRAPIHIEPTFNQSIGAYMYKKDIIYGIAANENNAIIPIPSKTIDETFDEYSILEPKTPIRILAYSNQSELTFTSYNEQGFETNDINILFVKDVVLQNSSLTNHLPKLLNEFITTNITMHQQSSLNLSTDVFLQGTSENIIDHMIYNETNVTLITDSVEMMPSSSGILTNAVITKYLKFDQFSKLILLGNKTSLNNAEINIILNPGNIPNFPILLLNLLEIQESNSESTFSEPETFFESENETKTETEFIFNWGNQKIERNQITHEISSFNETFIETLNETVDEDEDENEDDEKKTFFGVPNLIEIERSEDSEEKKSSDEMILIAGIDFDCEKWRDVIETQVFDDSECRIDEFGQRFLVMLTKKKKKLSTGALVGIIVGSVVGGSLLIVGIVLLICYCYNK